MAVVQEAELLIRLINIFIICHTHTHIQHTYKLINLIVFCKYNFFCCVGSPLSPPSFCAQDRSVSLKYLACY